MKDEQTEADREPLQPDSLSGQASESSYAALFEMAHDAIFLTDPTGTILEVNNAACELVHADRESLVGAEVTDFLLRHNVARFKRELAHVRPGSRRDMRSLGVRRDGSPFVADVRAWIMPDGTMAAIARDVSAEEQLIADLEGAVVDARRNEARSSAIGHATRAVLENEDFKDAAQSVLDLLVELTGAAIGHVLVNDPETGEMRAVCGVGTEQITPANGIAHPNPFSRSNPCDEGVYFNRPGTAGTPTSTPEAHPPIHNSLFCPLLVDGHTSGLVGIMNRPTDFCDDDLRLAETLASILAVGLKSSRTKVALEQSERKLRLAFEGSRDAVFWAEAATGTVIHCNEAAEALLGRPRSELIGLHQTSLHPPDHEAETTSAFRKAVNLETTGLSLDEVLHADGRRIPVEISTAVIEVDGLRIIQGGFRDVSARQSLWERYLNLFEHMLDGFALHEIITNEQGEPVDYRYLAVNPAFERLTGIKTEDIVGKTVLEVMPETENIWIETFGHVALTGEPIRYEDYSAAIGKYFEVEAYSPGPGQFACIFMDVTERRLAEERRRENEMRLELAQEAARAGMWEFDPHTGKAVWSDSLWQLLGLSPDEFEAGEQSWIASVSDEDQPRTIAAWTAAIENGTAYEAEWRAPTDDGSSRWLMARGRPLVGDHGQIERYVGITMDITNEKLSRERLAHANRVLDSANKVARIGMWEWLVDGDRVMWSSELFDFTHRALEHGAPSYAEMQRYYAPESWVRLAACVEEALRAGVDYDTELEMHTEEGTSFWTRVVGTPLRDENGLLVGLHGAVHDIDRRKQAELELLEHRARLRDLATELLSSRETECRRIAVELHDSVGQALAAAKMSMGMLRSDADDDQTPEFDRLLGLVDYAIDGVRSLTMDLSPPALYELGLGAALDWLAATFTERYNLSCSVKLDAAVVSKRTTGAVMMFRVARELLNNVHRHSGVDRASVSVWLLDDTLRLAVSDDGCGFDVATALRTRLDRGSFGLFSIHEEVASAGGTIEFDSAPGRGAKIDVRIPLGAELATSSAPKGNEGAAQPDMWDGDNSA